MRLGYSRVFGSSPLLTNLHVWFKTPIAGQVANAEILTWPDSSGHGKDGTGPVGFAPIYKTNILDGFAVARFVADATHEPLTFNYNGIIESWTEATIYILIKRTQDPGAGGGSGTALWRFTNQILSTHFNFQDNHIYDSVFANSRYDTGDPTLNLSTNFRLYAVKSKASDWTSYLDTVQHFHTGVNTTSFDNIGMLGQSGTLGTRFGLDADVAELLIYKSWHDDPTRALVEAYFSAKYPSLDF